MKKIIFTLFLAVNIYSLVPREVFFSDPQRTQVALSPDGKTISYLASVDGILNIWIQPVGAKEARPVTFIKNRPVAGYVWSADSSHLLYLSDYGGDENHHLFSLNLATNEVKNLTPAKGAKASILQTSKKHPKEVLVYLNERDPSLFDIYRINIETGKRTLVFENKDQYGQFIADENLLLRAALRTNADGEVELCVKECIEKQFRILDTYPIEDARDIALLGLSKDGDKLLIRDTKTRDKACIKTFSFTDQSIKESFYYDNEVILNASLNPKTYHPDILFTYWEKQNNHLVNTKLQEHWDNITKLAKDQTINFNSRSEEHPLWLIGLSSPTSPPQYYLYNLDTKATDFLFSSNEAVSSLALVPAEIHTIQARDNLPLISYLVRPANANGPTPLVLFVHGGPWARDYYEYNPYHQWLANRGYAVLAVNFRGSQGFGKKFLNAGNREWGRKMQDDLEDAVAWAIEQNIANPGKVAIMGGSYGGYATLVGMTRTPKLFAAGVDIVGPSHLQTLLDSTPPYWKTFLKQWDKRVGPLSDKAFFDAISPLTHVAKIERPLLILQGQNDPRVKCSESEQIVTAMQEKNIPVTYTLFPDEGHGFRKEKNRLASIAIIEQFLAKHLGGQNEPLGASITNSSAQIPVGKEYIQN